MIGKKRLALAAGSVTAAGAVATLVAGTTFGLFSAQAGSDNNTFSSGSVSISKDASSAPCAIVHAVPGDTSGASPCTFVINNGSNVSTYAAVDVFIATGKSATTPPTKYGDTTALTAKDLYDGSNSTGLTFTVKDGALNSFTVPVGPANVVSCSLAATDPFSTASTALSTPSADTCYEIKDLLLSTSAIPSSTTSLGTLSTAWNFQPASGNEYQGGDALIVFNAHSVQSGNNTLDCVTATPTVGQECAPDGTFSWS